MGKTLVNRTTGMKNANDALKGLVKLRVYQSQLDILIPRRRIVEVSLADLQKDEDHSFRKVKLRVDEVQVEVIDIYNGAPYTYNVEGQKLSY